MKLNEQFPFLSHFFFSYFHQDWHDEYDDEEMAVKEFVSDDGAEVANRTLQELDQFISLELKEADLREAVVEDLGSDYYPESKYQFMSDWLKWLRLTMAKYIEEKPAPKIE